MRESLCKRINEHNCQRERCKAQTERVQLPCREKKKRAGGGRKTDAKRGAQKACRNMADLCPGIFTVNFGVDQAVEGHCRRPRSHHRDNDPQHLPPHPAHRKTAFTKRQQRPRQRKRKREHGVLELNHVERAPKTFPTYSVSNESKAKLPCS